MHALARRHPWLAASLGAHVVLAAALYTAGPVRIEHQRDAGVRAQVNAALEQTGRREMSRQLRAMEAIEEALEQSAGLPAAVAKDAKDGKPPTTDPAARARELAAAIEQVRQKIRAADMARVLRIPEAEARKRIQAEQARRSPQPKPQPKPPPQQPQTSQRRAPALAPQAQVAQLAAQARAVLAERRAQLLAQRQGVAVKSAGAAGAGPLGAGGKAGDGRGKGSGAGASAGAGNAGTPSAAQAGRLDALAQGLGMGAPGALTGSSLDMSDSGFSDARGYGAYLAPPPVDAGGVQRGGGGRVLGAGGPYASRVYLDTWYVIGPFAGQGRDSRHAVYPPERGIDLDAVYYGKNDDPVRWRWQQYDSYPAVPRPRAENAVYYAYTEVRLERDMDVWLWIGADDDSKMWVNDRLVWISGQVDDKPWYRQPFYTLQTDVAARNLTEGQRKLHLQRGRNTILFKLYNGMDLMFFSVVLTKA